MICSGDANRGYLKKGADPLEASDLSRYLVSPEKVSPLFQIASRLTRQPLACTIGLMASIHLVDIKIVIVRPAWSIEADS